MTGAKDEDLADLFGAFRAPARDPLFRLRVLERRERARFRRRAAIMLSAAFGIAILAGGVAPAAGVPVTQAAIALFAAAVVAALALTPAGMAVRAALRVWALGGRASG